MHTEIQSCQMIMKINEDHMVQIETLHFQHSFKKGMDYLLFMGHKSITKGCLSKAKINQTETKTSKPKCHKNAAVMYTNKEAETVIELETHMKQTVHQFY
jgi:hypothetical protein